MPLTVPDLPKGKDLRLTRTLNWRDHVWLVDVTFTSKGHAEKISIESVKEGDPDRYLLLDAVALLNPLLALGVPLSIIRSDYVTRIHGGPMSIIGTLIELVYAMEVEDRPAMALAHEVAK